MNRDGRRRRRLAGAALALALASTPAPASPAERQWRSVPVAGGTAALARAAGLAAGLPAWRVLFEAARRRHGLWGEDMAAALEAPAEPAGDGAGVVPLPLSPQVWRELLGRPDAADAELAAAILADRRSALLYRGLAGLDEPTLASLAAEREVLSAIRAEAVEAFAAFGSRFRVRDGAVVLPGGPETAAAWERLVGASPGAPAKFLLALVRAREGRRAFLYDSIARLDDAHQRYALGLDLAAGTRPEPLAALAVVFDGEEPWWRHAGPAFARSDADAARLLREVRLTRGGALASPSSAAFWDGLFARAGDAAATRSAAPAGPAPAAWLADRVAGGSHAVGRLRLEQVLFAQRVFGEAPEPAPGPLLVAIDGVRDARALVLVLERLGSRDPSLFAEGVRAARALSRPGEGREHVLRAFQAALALVERARLSGSLDVAGAERLARSLFHLPAATAGTRSRALAAWLESELVPALSRAVATPEDPDVEAVVLRGVLGDVDGPAAVRPLVEWEGLRYRVDPARAELRRVRRVRERQDGPSLGDALGACRGPGPARRDPCAAPLGASLTALVYALDLGDADGAALAGGDPSRRHELSPDPWALPEEVFAPGVPWHLRGSLLGLGCALAGVAIHSLADDEMPSQPPVLTAAAARSLAAAAVLADPGALDEKARDALVEAIAAGRRRAAALASGSADVDAAGRDAGLEPWRVRALDWLLREEPGAREAFFSLGELLLLGAPAASLGGARSWGSWDPPAGGLQLRQPGARSLDEASGRQPEPALAEGFVDLSLRVALHLQERRLPASLGPAVVARLVPYLLAEARPLAPDDRLGLDAWVHALPADRLDDAIASLAGRGPLQPGTQPREAR
jgi:hypothetical protein